MNYEYRKLIQEADGGGVFSEDANDGGGEGGWMVCVYSLLFLALFHIIASQISHLIPSIFFFINKIILHRRHVRSDQIVLVTVGVDVDVCGNEDGENIKDCSDRGSENTI